jgi:hypothetical protein
MTALLAKAHEQLESAGPYSLRRACWLARAALEQMIETRLKSKGIQASNASERAKITCLEGAYADDRDFVFRVEYAWNRLSDACHQHAYQLAPTYGEVGHLINLVESLSTA